MTEEQALHELYRALITALKVIVQQAVMVAPPKPDDTETDEEIAEDELAD